MAYIDYYKKYIMECPYAKEKTMTDEYGCVVKIRDCKYNNMPCHTVRKLSPERCPAAAYINTQMAEEFKNKVSKEK